MTNLLTCKYTSELTTTTIIQLLMSCSVLESTMPRAYLVQETVILCLLTSLILVSFHESLHLGVDCQKVNLAIMYILFYDTFIMFGIWFVYKRYASFLIFFALLVFAFNIMPAFVSMISKENIHDILLGDLPRGACQAITRGYYRALTMPISVLVVTFCFILCSKYTKVLHFLPVVESEVEAVL